MVATDRRGFMNRGLATLAGIGAVGCVLHREVPAVQPPGPVASGSSKEQPLTPDMVHSAYILENFQSKPLIPMESIIAHSLLNKIGVCFGDYVLSTCHGAIITMRLEISSPKDSSGHANPDKRFPLRRDGIQAILASWTRVKEEQEKNLDKTRNDVYLKVPGAYVPDPKLERMVEDQTLGIELYKSPPNYKLSKLEQGLGDKSLIKLGREVLILGSEAFARPKPVLGSIRTINHHSFVLDLGNQVLNQYGDVGAPVYDRETHNLLGMISGQKVEGTVLLMPIACSIESYKKHI
ncbi:hypothetical protein JW711_00195 [Candidatus Woesearchaeota archaeon]|nr:hypothetical protein [Candidatus Woesearchaeota archaeon]